MRGVLASMREHVIRSGGERRTACQEARTRYVRHSGARMVGKRGRGARRALDHGCSVRHVIMRHTCAGARGMLATREGCGST